MEAAILEKVVITLVGLAVPALVTWLTTQVVKYRKLVKKEEDETVKKTIINTLSDNLKPINDNISSMQSDISIMQDDIRTLQNSEVNFSTRLNPMQDEIEHLKDDITEILDTIKQQGIDLNNLSEDINCISDKEKHLEHETRCAWRYRIRTLCHVYIKRGYMSHDEFSQLQEMFNLYTAIGGNGQTKELYEKTMQLDIKTDAEIAALEEEANRK